VIIYSLSKKNAFISDVVNVTVSGMKSDETVADDAQKLKHINPKNCAEH